jgi:hypothetical protein
VTSFVLSILFNFIVCKLSRTPELLPSMSINILGALLGFGVLKGYTAIRYRYGLLKQSFTRQKNIIIQTCLVASAGVAFNNMFFKLVFTSCMQVLHMLTLDHNLIDCI